MGVAEHVGTELGENRVELGCGIEGGACIVEVVVASTQARANFFLWEGGC